MLGFQLGGHFEREDMQQRPLVPRLFPVDQSKGNREDLLVSRTLEQYLNKHKPIAEEDEVIQRLKQQLGGSTTMTISWFHVLSRISMQYLSTILGHLYFWGNCVCWSNWTGMEHGEGLFSRG